MFEPDRCRRKMQESDEMSCEFFIASGNASKPLEFVDETFDDVVFSVADAVIVPWLFAIAAGGDERLYLLGCEAVWKRVRFVAFVGNNGIKVEWGEQRFSLGHIMALTPGQDELEGKAKGIDEEIDLAAESAPAPTQALFLLRAPFFDPPAALIWARAAVLSGITAAMSGSWANSWSMSAQTQCGAEYRKPNHGSIPACAGEPLAPCNPHCVTTVYPRVCGGTRVSGSLTCGTIGLSPRVRGNRVLGSEKAP